MKSGRGSTASGSMGSPRGEYAWKAKISGFAGHLALQAGDEAGHPDQGTTAADAYVEDLAVGIPGGRTLRQVAAGLDRGP